MFVLNDEEAAGIERDIEKDLAEIECAIKEHTEKDNSFTVSVLQRCYQIAHELKKYKKIGTIEEFTDAKRKQKKEKPEKIVKVDRETLYMECPNCKLTTVLYNGMHPDFCPKCGQGINLE